MAPESPTHNSAAPQHSLPLPALQRARLHAELAGMDALLAARTVTHAQRRCSGAADDQVRFWHALYVELAPLNRSGDTADSVANALIAMPLESRTAILLRLGEALSPQAIAQVLGEPETRAEQHLAQAVIQLRQQLASGRTDADWLRDLTNWVHAHEPASARLKRLQRLPAAVNELPPAWTTENAPRRSPARRIWMWSALAVVLTALGLARLVADDFLLLRTTPPPTAAVPIDPVAELLAMQSVDLAIVDSDLNLTLLPRLDFYLWLARGESNLDDPAARAALSATPVGHTLAGSPSRAAAWAGLAPAERAGVLNRLDEWRSLSAPQQAALRLNLPHWMALDAAGVRAILQQHAAYSGLDAEARRVLDDAFEKLSPTQRRALLPAVVNNENDLARELFVFVPLDQYTATIEMLNALPSDAQTHLRQLTRRLPPWQREALRVDLLAQPESSRAEWLKERLSER